MKYSLKLSNKALKKIGSFFQFFTFFFSQPLKKAMSRVFFQLLRWKKKEKSYAFFLTPPFF
jgi:hypothetical protein